MLVRGRVVRQRRGEQRVGDQRLRAQRLAGPVDVGIEAGRFGNGLRAGGRRRRRGSPCLGLARRLLPGQVRRQIVVGPEVPQIDHVAARRHAFRAIPPPAPRRPPGSPDRTSPPRTGCWGCCRPAGHAARRCRARWRSRPRCRSCRGRRPASSPRRPRVRLVGRGAADDFDVVVVGHHDVRIRVQFVHLVVIGSGGRKIQLQEATDLEQEILAVERLQHVLVGARLQLPVLLEGRRRLLPGDQQQRHLAEAGAAPKLVADRVADLLRLDGEHDDRGLVGAAPLHGVIAARDVLDLKAVRREQPADLVRGGGVRFDAQRDSVGHLASSETERSKSARPSQRREGANMLSESEAIRACASGRRRW